MVHFVISFLKKSLKNLFYNLLTLRINPINQWHTIKKKLKFKAQTMVRRDAVLFYCLTVLRRRVALVGEPVILGILGSEGIHEVITISLSEDACRCYGKVFAVALDDGGVRQGLAIIQQR